MSLPIALGAKWVSSRPLVGIRDYSVDKEDQYQYYADDGITGLKPVKIPGSMPLTATAVCPLQEWLAFVTIEYYDLLMVVDNDDDEGETPTTESGRPRHQMARHSTIAELRIQISPLSVPFSSTCPNILHRLTLPRAPSFATGYLDEDHVQQVREQSQVRPRLVFSSDRRRLACLIPYLRGHQSALVAFDLKRPIQHLASLPRPKLPAYIPTPSQERPTKPIWEARDDPQWLALSPGGTALDIQHTAEYWLYNITSICNASTQANAKGSSVLLAGCRDGSILGISFQPLLLVGRLYHPADRVNNKKSITCLSHMTISPMPNKHLEAGLEEGDGIVGRLVVIHEQGMATIFRTRMILSPFDANGNDLEDISNHFHPEDSTFNLYHGTDMDATDHSHTYSKIPTNVIHGESFSVVKTGRRHSLPANSRLSEESQPLIRLPYHLNPNKFKYTNSNTPQVGNVGLVMLLEPLSEYPGHYCRAQWVSGAHLALLETPPTRNDNTNGRKSQNRVAQVVGVLPNRPPEVLSELTLTSDDLLEHAHTNFSLSEEDNDDDADANGNISFQSLLAGNSWDATFGIRLDPHTGCLAISSARYLDASTPGRDSSTKAGLGQDWQVFVCLWNWRCNVLGFTAVATSSTPQRPISSLIFARDRNTNARHLAHLRSAGGTGELDRISKDLYRVATLSPSADTRRRGSDVHASSPLLLTPTSVTFAVVSNVSETTSELEWKECLIPVAYRLEYGSPSIAAASSSGKSIAVASSRGLCVLECTPGANKGVAGKYRKHLGEDDQQHEYERRGNMLPPKWHLFGNESGERAFRVLTMTWWSGTSDAKRSHASDDLLVAVIEIQRKEDHEADPPGTCYLACWSQRRLDGPHQRLRPLDDNLQSFRSQWGVRLPDSFRTKSLRILEQPVQSDKREKQCERKALGLLTSTADARGTVCFLVFQFHAIQSIGRTQSFESYKEHNPFSVLSKQCSSGQIDCTVDGSSIALIFLAGASFQFDLRRSRIKPSGQEDQVNEIVGTLGVVRTPGCGIEAVAITSSGPSKRATILNKHAHGSNLLDVKNEMKSSEIASYWLSDLIQCQHPILTNFGETTMIDFFVWSFQLADGKVFCWFVPCLYFPHIRSDPKSDDLLPNLFSSKIMLGLVCPAGTSTTWLRPSPAKTGKDFMLGCMPQSSHGCILTSGQASRKFHRSIIGDFDNSLFASDFLEHEFLYQRDFELSPPAFISSIAALLSIEVFFSFSQEASSEKFVREQNPNHCPVNAGGADLKKAILAVGACTHAKTRSRRYQDAAFMALRLLLLRSTEQLTDDLRKRNAVTADDKSVLSASVLPEVLRVLMCCSSSRLQFASLVLEVGRQLEPTCFPNLFPLQTPQHCYKAGSNGDVTSRSTSWNDLRAVNDIFCACLEDGSLLCSVSTLPMIPGRSLSREYSMLVLDHCLDAYNNNCDVESNFFFDFSTEERSMMRDIFRFGAKLEDSGRLDLDISYAEEGKEETESVESGSDSPHSSDDDEIDEYPSGTKGYSFSCGMLSLSWFSSRPNPSQHNLNGGRDSNQRETKQLLDAQGGLAQDRAGSQEKDVDAEDNDNLGTVAGSVATLLIRLVVPNNTQLEEAYGWKRASALAFLLLGQDESLLPKVAAEDCKKMAMSAVALNLAENRQQLQARPVEDGIAELLTRCMMSCSIEIGTIAAGRVLDLIMVILERTRRSSSSDTTLPGLFVIGISAGHVSGRVNEILDIEDNSMPLSRCYWVAKERDESLHSF